MRLLEHGLSLVNRLLGRITDLTTILALVAASLAGFVLVAAFQVFKDVLGVRKSWPEGDRSSDGNDDSEEHYGLLGLRPGASQAQIKAAYRELVKRYHPDKIPHNLPPSVRAEMEERMKRINEAYRALTTRSQPPTLRLEASRGILEECGREIMYAERILSKPDGGADALAYIHDAATRLVQTLHRAACGNSTAAHYYDMLSDLLMSDVISLEEFELLSNIRRRWSDMKRQGSPSNRDMAIMVRALRRTYLKVVERYLG